MNTEYSVRSNGDGTWTVLHKGNPVEGHVRSMKQPFIKTYSVNGVTHQPCGPWIATIYVRNGNEEVLEISGVSVKFPQKDNV